MAISGDNFHIKGVPAHAMVVKPSKTASQVSFICSPFCNTQPQGESPVRSTLLKGHRLVFYDMRKLVRTCVPYLLKTGLGEK